MPAIPAIRQSRFLVIGYLRQVPCSLGGNPTASDRAKGYREGRTLLRPDTYAIQIWLEEISHIPASPTQATGNGPRVHSGAHLTWPCRAGPICVDKFAESLRPPRKSVGRKACSDDIYRNLALNGLP